MVDGNSNSFEEGDSNNLLFLEDRRSQIAFDPSIRSFHSVLPFDLQRHKRKQTSCISHRRGSNPLPFPLPRSKTKKTDALNRSATIDRLLAELL